MKKEIKTSSPNSWNPIKIKTIILSIVIAIVLTLFVVYLIQAIYKKPDYNNYCGKISPAPYPEENLTKGICEANNGTWVPQNIECIKAPCAQGYCDYYSKCQKQFDDAENKYKLIVFIVSVIIGLIAISAGIMLTLASVSSGLMIGGTFLTFYGTIIYWANLNNFLRASILGIALIILIWLAYKKLQN